jgi:hypothetical protein
MIYFPASAARPTIPMRALAGRNLGQAQLCQSAGCAQPGRGCLRCVFRQKGGLNGVPYREL